MPFEEKVTWVSAVVSILVPAIYFAVVLTQLGDVSVGEIDYQRPLLIAIIASIALMVAGAVAVAAGTAIKAEVTGEESADDVDRKDERDVSINRRGDVAGFYVVSVGAVGALALTMLESDYFWIANALYLSFVVAALVSAIVKIVAYRRGL